MSITYTPATNFGAKDSLPTNDPDKVIKGVDFTTEFSAIQSAFTLAAPTASPTFTGTVTIPTADINGGTIDGVAFGSGTIDSVAIGGTTPAAGAFTTLQATSMDSTPIGGTTPAAATFTTLQATSMDSTPIGGTTPAAGAFTTLEATSLDSTPIGGTTPAAGTFTTLVATDLEVNTDTLYVDSATSRVGIENAAPSYTLEVTGEAVATQGMPYIAESTTARTLALTDSGNYIRCTNSGATTVTIPPNSSVAFPTGAEVIIFQAGAGQVTIAAGAGVTLNSKEGNLKISAQYAAVTCKKVATDTWDVIGDLSA